MRGGCSTLCCPGAAERCPPTARVSLTMLTGPDGASVLLLAKRPILAGEEVSLAYKEGVLHRPDASLALYGFLPAPRDPPLLAALDLPGGGRYNPWRRTPADDEGLGARMLGWVETAACTCCCARDNRLALHVHCLTPRMPLPTGCSTCGGGHLVC